MTEPLGGTVFAVTLFVDDLARTKEFYDRVFAADVINDDGQAVTYALDGLVVNLLDRAHAPELIAPAEVAPPGARHQLTLDVADVDATCALLAERGVPLLNGPMDRPWGPRTAAFADPDGHVWEVATR